MFYRVLKPLAKYGVLLVLAGCAASSGLKDSGSLKNDSDTVWRKYYENDGSLKEMTYFIKFKDNADLKDYIGDLWRKEPLDNEQNKENIGPAFVASILPDGTILSTLIMNADTQQVIRLDDIDALEQIGEAKNIKIYFQGGNTIETITYQAQDSLCSVLKQGKEIAARSVTNYYLPDNTFIITTLESTINKDSYQLKNQELSGYGFDEPMEGNEFDSINKDDLAKQQRIITEDICGMLSN